MVYLSHMNRGRRSGGYTIVETLIFLAVSSALFVSAMILINGRQGKTEFSQAARNFEIELQGIANDVSTGYYSNAPNTSGNYIKCTAGTPVTITTPDTTDKQGANQACIFIGRSLQISADANVNQYKVFTLVGKRESSPGVDSDNITESGIKAIAPGVSTPSTPDLAEIKQALAYNFGCMMYATVPLTPANDKPCTNPPQSPASAADLIKTDSLTFMTTFVGMAGGVNRSSGDTQVDLLVHNPGVIPADGRDSKQVVDQLNRYRASVAPITPITPVGGVYICLDSTSSNQFGLLRLGGNGSRFATDLVIKNGSCR